MPEFNWERI